jgi:hypothetical protein
MAFHNHAGNPINFSRNAMQPSQVQKVTANLRPDSMLYAHKFRVTLSRYSQSNASKLLQGHSGGMAAAARRLGLKCSAAVFSAAAFDRCFFEPIDHTAEGLL